MKLALLAVGTRPPHWVVEGFNSYRKRMPRHLQLELMEVAGGPTGKNQSPRETRAQEAKALLARLPPSADMIALEMTGKAWTTDQLASQLDQWQMRGNSLAFIIGGAEGLDPSLLQMAQQKWSLGPLTLPHALVRVLVAEQLYRAWTILSNHPYHRA